tara:strand:+ start:530 stop:910 length:381 start_codon:yes stop_codon:yes gene_type:complete
MEKSSLEIESKKENLLYSKELRNLLGENYIKRPQEDLYFEAVFKNKKIMLEYIGMKIKKNRVKIKCTCDINFIDTVINDLPSSIKVFYKDKEINNIKISINDKITLSVNKIDNKYIVEYNIKNKTA